MVEQTVDPSRHLEEQGSFLKRKSLDANPWWAQALIFLVLIGAGLLTLIPMVNVWAISFSEAHEIYKNPMMLWPQSFTL